MLSCNTRMILSIECSVLFEILSLDIPVVVSGIESTETRMVAVEN